MVAWYCDLSKGCECCFHYWKYQVCLRSPCTAIVPHQYYWHQLIEKSKLLPWQQRASAQARWVKKRLCQYSTVRGRETALCLACYEKLVCLLSLMFSGLRPNQWQKEALHSAVPSARELQREAVMRCYMEKTAGKLNHSPLIYSKGWRGHRLRGVQFFQLLTLIGVVRKMFLWNKKKF